MTTTAERPAPRTVYDLGTPAHRWYRQAACKDADTDAWIVSKTESHGGGGDGVTAMKICRRCPVRWDCFLDAVQTDDRRAIRAAMGVGDRDQWLAEEGVHRPGVLPADPGNKALAPRGPYKTINIDRVVVLRKQNRSHREIAEELGCTKETVARRLKSAREAGLL
jgi:hypothetical protein